MDLVEILQEMADISPDLKNFVGKCSISRFSRVYSSFGEKTRQPTRHFQVLEVETRRQPSPTSSRPILRPDRMGGLGLGFCWTPLLLALNLPL